MLVVNISQPQPFGVGILCTSFSVLPGKIYLSCIFYLGLWLNLSYQTQFKILVGYVPYWGRSNHIFMELRLLRMQWIYCLRKSIIRLVNRLRLSNFEVMEKKRFDPRRCVSYLQVSCCILVRVWRAVTGSPRQRLKADYPKTRFR